MKTSHTSNGERGMLRQEIEAQQQVLDSLLRRLEAVESDEIGGHGIREPLRDSDHAASDRRGFLRTAGAVAVGAASTVLLRTEPAAATDGQAIFQGQTNTGTLQTIVNTSGASPGPTQSADSAALRGLGGTNLVGLSGEANGSQASGLLGLSDAGYGVYGSSPQGYALYAAGGSRIGMGAHFTTATLPTTGSYAIGDLIRNSVGDMYVCVTAGTGTASKFRKLAGPATSGSLHILAAPLRAYDSRPGEPAASGGDGPIVANGNSVSPASRTISLQFGKDGSGLTQPAVPAGASGALFNLTTVATVGVGYLTAQAAGLPWSRTSTSNWGATGQSVAGFVTSAVNLSAQIAVFCPLNSSQFLIDVVGYYL